MPAAATNGSSTAANSSSASHNTSAMPASSANPLRARRAGERRVRGSGAGTGSVAAGGRGGRVAVGALIGFGRHATRRSPPDASVVAATMTAPSRRSGRGASDAQAASAPARHRTGSDLHDGVQPSRTARRDRDRMRPNARSEHPADDHDVAEHDHDRRARPAPREPSASVTNIAPISRLVGERIEQRADPARAAVAREPAVHRVGEAGRHEHAERGAEGRVQHQRRRRSARRTAGRA